MTRVKICGIHTADGLAQSVKAGADAVGFVVEYPDPVPWDLSREEALALRADVPPFVSSVVVTTGTAETVVDLATMIDPDVVQLHGEESVDTTDAIADRLTAVGIDTIKAIDIGTDAPEADRERVAKYAQTGIDGIVLDASADDRRGGGTGRTVPWRLARTVVAETSIPVVLAGGLTPENVAEAVSVVEPYGVDVISGVERDDHTKDPDRVRAFVDAATGRDS